MPFILDGLETESYDRVYSDRQLLRRISRYFGPHRRKMVTAAVTLTLNSVAGSGGPILIARSLDMIQKDPSLQAMILLSTGILLLGVFAWGFNYIRQKLSTEVVGDVVLKLRNDVFDATINHDLSFFDENSSGRIVSRVSSDTQDFSNVVTLVLDLMSQVLLVAILSIWLFVLSVPLTLLLFAMAPVAIGIALAFRRLARRVSRDARRVTAEINSQIQESISGIMVAKTFRREPALFTQFLKNNKLAFKMGLRRGLVINGVFPVLGAAAGLGIAALVYGGGLAARAGAITPGEWYLFMQAVGLFWWPLTSIASFWSQFQDGLAAAERAFSLIDAEPRVVQKAEGSVGGLNGRIEFRDVVFSYDERETVLNGFSLEIEAGETVAFVGHTGAGKSSIARLITRFYEFQSGDILVDGKDIRRLDLDAYRLRIGIVPQAPFLFTGTVRDNIRYGLPDTPDQEVHRAAEKIAGGEWLRDLATGLDTEVGPRGASLSMGQRQLVALVRILLKNPSVMILDEATASVDPFTEIQIQEGLDTIMGDRTSIVIAHRLSTVRQADKIVVLEKGRIIQLGTHEGLMAQGGHYAELYNTYFRHQSLEYIEGFAGAAQG